MKLYTILVILILVLSALFRFGFPDVMEFLGDQEGVSHDALSAVRNNSCKIISYGRGIPHLATYDLILQFLFLYSTDPRIITILSVGIPIFLAVILCLLFCLKFFNKRVALVATALFGFSGWAIIYSRMIWGINLLPFFSILIIYLLAVSLNRNKLKLIFLPLFLFFFTINFHLTSLILLFIVCLIVVIYWRRVNFKYFSLGIFLLGLLLLIPYFCGKTGVDFKDSASTIIASRSLGGGYKIGFNFVGWITSMDLMARTEWYYDYLGIEPQPPAIGQFVVWALRILFFIGLITAVKRGIYQYKTNRAFSPYLVISLWYLVFVTVFGFINKTGYPHYFNIILPVYFIIMAVGFDFLANFISGQERFDPWELIILVIFLLFWQPIVGSFVLISILIIKSFRVWSSVAKKVLGVVLYPAIVLILVLEAAYAFSNLNYLNRTGGIMGHTGYTLGVKMSAVEYVIDDAQRRYGETGLKSCYSIYKGRGYGFLFERLDLPVAVVPREELKKGFHYIIVNEPEEYFREKGSGGFIHKEEIGPILVIVEKID